jgi:FAD/FMN-containing dehydrogenase/Fe-S oxidoreductase
LTDATTALAADLGKVIDGEVRFDPAHRAMWSADASNYRKVPIGVVAPRDEADVEAALQVCRRHEVPVLPRGAGTSIAGNAVNTAVILDFTRHMNRILELDPQARTARVEPGVVCDQLRNAAAPHGLTFGPDPSTHNRCTLGGMIGNNACGSHSVAWGKTVDNTERLELYTYRGERLDTAAPTGDIPDKLRILIDRMGERVRTSFPDLTRRVSGYNLDQLLPEHDDLAKAVVGAEGTLGTVVAATMRLVESPPARALAVLGFPDAYVAADNVMAVREHAPLTIEGMDAGLIAALRAQNPTETASRALPPGGGWLYVETGAATRAEAEAEARAVAAAMRPHGLTEAIVESDPARMRALWRIREDGAGLLTRSPDGGEAWPGWEDAAVPPERFGSYLREFDRVLARHGRRGVYYGHFGDGCLHVRIDFDLLTRAGIANFRAFLEDAADVVVAHGGSLSGEHGDGRARSELLTRMYPPEIIEAFEEFKGAFDPDDRMNPGCLVRSARLDADLRVFVGTPTVGERPQLAFARDRGSFTRATRRCLGVGKCVTAHGGVMCPSYRATGEERHSTRGRARLLFEMATGEVITGGWRDDDVAEALDLCLSCKGCRTDCPVGVDMAAYKTEFLAQRYRRRPRPVAHYSMGALPRWLRMIGRLPPALIDRLNALARMPAPAALVKRAGGIAPERQLPLLARTPFTRHTAVEPGEAPRGPAPRGRLLLWPDTFTNHFDPGIAAAAVSVLEALGYEVELPPRAVCCGLTWVSTGQVGPARRVLRRSLRTIGPWLAAGVPVVGLEPSCTAALRTDAAELLPDDPLVPAVAGGVRTFAELLAEHADELRARCAGGSRAMVQVHCHQHADLGFEADRTVLAALGVEADVLDSGCCGLAGNFGFERGHYAVSMAAAERVLLPAVRAAAPEVTVLADGFSCRTQLRQATTREPVHLAQLTAHALGLPRPGRADSTAHTGR